ncbi:hypothetical protein E4U58_001991, partial [Claviceps cyperi]
LSYRLGKENILADALSRKWEDLQTHKAMKAASRTKNLFVPVALFTGKLCEDAGKEVELLDELLQSNKSDAELEGYRQLAKEKSGGWSLTEQGLLLKGD